MRIYVKRDGKINKQVADKIRKIVQKAAKTHKIKEDSIRVILTEMPDSSCYSIFAQMIPNQTIRDQVVKTICKDMTAITIYANTPIIVINLNHPQIRRALEWEDALDGLILHEVGHIRSKDKNLDSMIALATHTIPKEKLKELDRVTNGRAREIIQTIGQVLKDIKINENIIKEGYTEQIYRHYDNLLEEKFSHSEYTKQGKIDMIIATIALVPATLPFKKSKEKDYYDLIMTDLKVHMPDAHSLMKKIEPVFENMKIPPTAENMDKTIQKITEIIKNQTKLGE